MRCRNQDAVGSSLLRTPAITGQGCTYCADASGTGEGKLLGRSCCPFLQCAGQYRHCFAPNQAGVHVLAAGSRHPLAQPVCDVLLDRKKILLVGRALLCRASREKQILFIYRSPSHGAAWKSRACFLIENHSSLQYIQLFCTVEIGYYL